MLSDVGSFKRVDLRVRGTFTVIHTQGEFIFELLLVSTRINVN